MLEGFKIIGKIEQIEIQSEFYRILIENFGKGRWRKLKGVATVERISNGRVSLRKFIGMKHTESGNAPEK